MTFENIQEVFEFVYGRGKNKIGRFDKKVVFSPRIIAFFDKLDNPQKKIKIVHVAGTSGKGSTCNFLSHILSSQGFKVGMSVSPYLEKFNERIQFNNISITDQKFLEYFNECYPFLLEVESDINDLLSTFEILVGITYWAFWKEKVDYGIIEVGMGGRLDGTNVPNPSKLCVLNSIGLDHMVSLGDTLELIAGEKAGIIQKGNLVVALAQTADVNKVFQDKADSESVDLEFIFPEFDFETPTVKIDQETQRPVLNFVYNDSELEAHSLELSQIGDYQASNCALALRAVETLADRDVWNIDWSKIAQELKVTTFNGRFQFYNLPNKRLLILDGAHNPQKMQGFTTSVAKYFPNKKFNWIVGFKETKDISEIMDFVLANLGNINKIIITEFDVNIQKLAEQVIVSKLTSEISECLDSKGYTNYKVEPDLKKVIDMVKNSHNDCIVTGSLYLVGSCLNILNGNIV